MQISNFFRSDQPESPTDLIFVYLGLILGGLWIYANIIQKDIMALALIVSFLSTLKLVKIGSDYQKKRKATDDKPDQETKTTV